jgi:hypothetical protein
MFKRKTTTKLTFLTKESKIYPQILNPRTKFWPDWWRSLTRQDFPTMKTCPGFVDLLKNTITVPLWRDYEITYSDKIENVRVAAVETRDQLNEWFDVHLSEQYGDHYKNYIHVKLKTPWITICNDNTRFLMTDATWHRDEFENYRVLPGELEFRYQHSSHVNIFIPKSKTTKTLTLEAGTPICYLTPLTSNTIEIEAKRVNSDEWYSYVPQFFSFKNHYRTILKIIKEKG